MRSCGSIALTKGTLLCIVHLPCQIKYILLNFTYSNTFSPYVKWIHTIYWTTLILHYNQIYRYIHIYKFKFIGKHRLDLACLMWKRLLARLPTSENVHFPWEPIETFLCIGWETMQHKSDSNTLFHVGSSKCVEKQAQQRYVMLIEK